ncbi:MAG: pilin [Candidatus Staskawiczbacteria bacterium]|nr:pilin [Candidatus Staskawiczbacteria bacterium]
MNKKIITFLIIAGLFGLTCFAIAADCPPNQICNPISSNNFGELLTKIADGVGTLVASLGTIMLIVAGILYLTSAGNPERMGTAKKALTYAIIGIAIGLAAKGIVAAVKEALGVK